MTTSAAPPAYIYAEDLFPWNIYAYENTLKFMRDTSDIASVANLPVIDDSHPTIIFRHDGVDGSRQKYLFVGWKFNDKIVSCLRNCVPRRIGYAVLVLIEESTFNQDIEVRLVLNLADLDRHLVLLGASERSY